MHPFIPYGKQIISEEDVAAVVATLKSDYLTQGPMVDRFEQAIAEYCHANYAVAFSNATAALHCACLALEIGQGDLVWTSPITFVASANCALYCGANVDFVDIDPDTYNISVEKLAEKLVQAKKQNKLPNVVIPVHFAGQSCDMVAIKKLADQYGFKIIEDASHAIGARYKDAPVGNCQYSDICVFSFHPVKIITTGEGGVATTNNETVQKKLALYRTHGVTRDEKLMQGKSHGDWYYQQVDLGYNYRITDLQCALGLSQLNRLDEFVSKRHECVKHYNELFANMPIKTPYVAKDCYSSWHLYMIQTQPSGADRKKIFDHLRQSNIGVNVHYIPVVLQPYYQKLGFKAEQYPVAMNYYNHCITLPLHPQLTNDDQCYIQQKIQEALQ